MRIQSTFLTLGISLLVACGGGGGGGDNAPPQQAIPSSSSEPTTKTEDLVAPGNFEFSTAREVTFNIDAQSLNSERKFVSIYSRYRVLSNQRQVPHYDSRLLALTKEDLGQSRKILITNDIHEVMIQVVSDNLDDGSLETVLSIGSDNAVNWVF